MYNITREQAAETLWLSTRSIDRYIRSWKLRAQKEWKIVYIHSDDIDNFSNKSSKKQVIINHQDIHSHKVETKEISTQKSSNQEDFVQIFKLLKDEISQKDTEIKDLSLKLWKMEEIAKNSISLVEFKKNQYLLEESKKNITSNLDDTKKDLDKHKKLLKQERKYNYILMILLFVVFCILVAIWFFSI